MPPVPNDAGPRPAHLPLTFGVAKILIALHLLAAAANAGDWVYDRTPPSLGIAATVVLVLGWAVLAWFQGRGGSVRFAKVAAGVWLGLSAALGLTVWAINASQDSGEVAGGVVTLAATFVVAAPWHGIAGLLPPMPIPLRHALVMLGTVLVIAAAYLVGRLSDVGAAQDDLARTGDAAGPPS